MSELAKAFHNEPLLTALRLSVESFLDIIRNTQNDESASGEIVRDYIVETICKTERSLFPHPVFLSECVPAEKGRVFAKLIRVWDASPEHFHVTFRPRLDQQLQVSRYYFLKPSYKRKEIAKDTEDLVLYPLKPSSCFGIPSEKRVALLAEGDDEFTIFEQLLTNLSPHWKARIEIVEAGGASEMLHVYNHLEQASVYSHIVVVGDVVGASKDLYDIRKKNSFVYTLDPDLEGVQPQALQLALSEIAASLLFTEEEITNVVARARTEKRSTVACLKEYQNQRDKVTHMVFNDTERLKRKLAPVYACRIIDLRPCQQFLVPLYIALHLGFGHQVDDTTL